MGLDRYNEREFKSEAGRITQIRPWVRYWARILDMTLFGLIIGVMQVVFFPSKRFDDRSLGFIILILWNFIEAQLLSSWGSTPGKWMLKIKVRDMDSNKLSFMAALKRSTFVWFAGLGMGIFSLITMVISYSQLSEKGITIWDRNNECTVSHERIGVVRSIIVISIFVGFILVAALGVTIK